MKLKAPQPDQAFLHVMPSGNSYVSDGRGLITPLTSVDAAALRALGCVDVDEVEVTVPSVRQSVSSVLKDGSE